MNFLILLYNFFTIHYYLPSLDAFFTRVSYEQSNRFQATGLSENCIIKWDVIYLFKWDVRSGKVLLWNWALDVKKAPRLTFLLKVSIFLFFFIIIMILKEEEEKKRRRKSFSSSSKESLLFKNDSYSKE